MKTSGIILLLSSITWSLVAPCPFSKSSGEIPDDNTHRHLSSRVGGVMEDTDTKAKIEQIIRRQQEKLQLKRRSQQTTCMTQSHYDDIRHTIDSMAQAVSYINYHYCSTNINHHGSHMHIVLQPYHSSCNNRSITLMQEHISLVVSYV